MSHFTATIGRAVHAPCVLRAGIPTESASDPNRPSSPSSSIETTVTVNRIMGNVTVAEFDEANDSMKPWPRLVIRWQYRLRKLVSDSLFTKFFLSCIFLNTRA